MRAVCNTSALPPRSGSPASGSFDVMDEVGRTILAHHPLGIANPVRRERGGTKLARVVDQPRPNVRRFAS